MLLFLITLNFTPQHLHVINYSPKDLLLRDWSHIQATLKMQGRHVYWLESITQRQHACLSNRLACTRLWIPLPATAGVKKGLKFPQFIRNLFYIQLIKKSVLSEAHLTQRSQGPGNWRGNLTRSFSSQIFHILSLYLRHLPTCPLSGDELLSVCLSICLGTDKFTLALLWYASHSLKAASMSPALGVSAFFLAPEVTRAFCLPSYQTRSSLRVAITHFLNHVFRLNYMFCNC